MQLSTPPAVDPGRLVSILIRPEGRMQQLPSLAYGLLHRFQSSSGQKAGCNTKPWNQSPDATCFNPHPARRPDATKAWLRCGETQHRFQSSSGQKAGCNPLSNLNWRTMLSVSILIRPEGRMQLRQPLAVKRRVHVSILIRPEGRMQQRDQKACPAHRRVSILIRPEGRMQLPAGSRAKTAAGAVSILIRPEGRMQLPAGSRAKTAAGAVSILIRPEGRMQLPAGSRAKTAAGAVSILIRPEGRMQRRTPCLAHRHTICFNPHPARRPDAT